MVGFEVGKDKDLEGLQRYLSMLPPTSPDKAPAVLSFTRPRRLNIDWFSLLTPDDQRSVGSLGLNDDGSGIKDYFERRWRRRGITNVADSFSAKQGQAWGTGNIEVKLPFQPEPLAQVVNIYLIDSDSANASRVFVPIGVDSAPVRFDPVNEQYADLWERIRSVVLGRMVGEPDEFPGTQSISVSREVQLLRAEFERLDTLGVLAGKMREYALGDNHVSESIEAWWRDATQMPAGQRKFMEFASWGSIVQQRLDALAHRASEFGYVLALADRAIKLPNGAEIQLKKGELYRPYNSVITWTTAHTRYVTVVRYGSCGSREIVRIPTVEHNHHSASVVLYEKVVFAEDPVQTQIDALAAKRFKVYRVTRTELGYVSTTGEALRDIIRRCEDDEAFRRLCVVVVPENRSLFSGEQYNTGAFFFLRPMSAFAPSQFPAVCLAEDLSYTIQWIGTELGPLVRTICLGPGEERTISISNSYQQQVTDSRSVRSSSDVSMSSSEDFASEVENEAQAEFTKSQSSSVSVSGGFGIGPFSASASTSSTSSTSLRNFAKSVNKVAKRAARSFSRKITTDVTSSRTSVTTVSTSDSTSLNVKNVNEGRALNLVFHQVNNRFAGGLYLDEIRIEVVDSTELIAGSGLHDTYIYELHDLDRAMHHLRPAALPIDIKLTGPGIAPQVQEERFVKYWNALLDHLIEILQKEYRAQVEGNGSSELSSCGLVEFDPADADVETLQLAAGAPGIRSQIVARLKYATSLREWPGMELPRNIESLGSKFERVKAFLQSKVIQPRPLVPDSLIVASGGLYVDSMVGAMTSLEPFSDAMREIEKRRREAEVEKELASASETRARAAAIYRGVYNCITEIRVLGVGRIELQLRRLIEDGEWKVLYDGAVISDAQVEVGDKSVQIQWPNVPALPGLESLKRRLALLETKTFERLVYIDPTTLE